jgi:uncharacterized membrane protein YhaH (DUF805 family)
MSFSTYLFSFKGRINRAKLWLFILIGFAWEIVIISIAGAVYGLAGVSHMMERGTVPTSLTIGVTGAVAGILIAVLVIAYIYAAFAVTVKRLHDRNKGASWLLVFWLLPLVLYIIGTAILGGAVAMGDGSGAALWSLPFTLGALGIIIWAFVELYCLRGTIGDNRFGPDPLAGKS